MNSEMCVNTSIDDGTLDAVAVVVAVKSLEISIYEIRCRVNSNRE